jgi:CRP-like cAMP-binding protein
VIAQRRIIETVLTDVYQTRAELRREYRAQEEIFVHTKPVEVGELQKALSSAAMETFGMEVEDIYMLDRLKRVPLLKQLDDSDLRLLASHFRKQKFKQDRIVIRQGDGVGEESMCYFLDQGQVDVYVDGAKVARRDQDSYFGERGLVEDTPRSATIIAATDLVCLCLSRCDFRNLSETHETIRKAFDFRIECITKSDSFRRIASEQRSDLEDDAACSTLERQRQKRNSKPSCNESFTPRHTGSATGSATVDNLLRDHGHDILPSPTEPEPVRQQLQIQIATA